PAAPPAHPPTPGRWRRSQAPSRPPPPPTATAGPVPTREQDHSAGVQAAAQTAADPEIPMPDGDPPRGSTTRHGDTHSARRHLREERIHTHPTPATPRQTAAEHQTPHPTTRHRRYSRRHHPRQERGRVTSRTLAGARRHAPRSARRISRLPPAPPARPSAH